MNIVKSLIAIAVASVLVVGAASAKVVESTNKQASSGAGLAVFVYDDAYSAAACEQILSDSLKAWAERFSDSETVTSSDKAAKINGWLPGNGRAVRVSMSCEANKNGVIKETWRYTGVY